MAGEAAVAVEDDNGLKAILVIIGVEQAQLLTAMHGIGGVVHIQHDALGHLAKDAQ